MDSFTRRVELEDEDEAGALEQPLHLLPLSGDDPAGDDLDNGGRFTPGDDQIVPGQGRNLETEKRRRQPFYEGTSKID